MSSNRYDSLSIGSTSHLPTSDSIELFDAHKESTTSTRDMGLDEVAWPRNLRPIMPTPFEPFRRDRQDVDESSDEELSSLDGEDEKAGLIAELGAIGAANGWASGAKSRRRKTLCMIFLAILLGCLFSAFALSHIFRGRHTFRGEGLKPISMDHLKNGTFAVESEQLAWLAEAGDGVYSHRRNDGSILLENVNLGTTRVLVQGDAVKDEAGQRLAWSTFKVSADLKYILFAVDWNQQWRYSSHANFYVHTVESGETVALRPTSNRPHTAIASFSPQNHHIAYVHANDLYVLEEPPRSGDGRSAIRVTVSGSPTTFNGVPDWVYEEEIFTSDSATWWAPDGSKLAYLSFDEERVPEYSFPIYNPSPWVPGGDPYPSETVMRYPKPGYPNPYVTIHVFDLARYSALPKRPTPVENEATLPEVDPRVLELTYDLVLSKPFDKDDMIVSEVTWVGKDDLMIKVTDRTAQVQRTAHFRLGEADVSSTGGRVVVGQVVRDDDFGQRDGGWIEADQTIVGIDSTLLLHSEQADLATRPKTSYPPGYLDIVPDDKGFRHLAYFSPPDSATPVFLTKGNWEIVESISAIDVRRGLVYVVAANPSIERHVYAVPLPKSSVELTTLAQDASKTVEPTPLTDTKKLGWHFVSFSPFGGFYVLEYRGPSIPWQKLIKVGDQDFTKNLTDNTALAKTDAAFQKVQNSYSTLELEGGYSVNVMELRPPLMDESGRTKHPVLVEVYGGPNSQKVTTMWQRDWHHYLVTSLGYVVVRIDPRGTGFKGRQFRVGVRGKLGELEAADVVEATRLIAARPYVDKKRLGIWGWSYGGFLTAKVVETNSSLFTLAVAVAPVTDFRYYDSIYTERYMSTPGLNPVGYRDSAVTKMEGFKHLDFALAHGSGDDNVHFANSAALLDRLTAERVHDFRFRMFTDSDHSIQMRGAYWELMGWITDFLIEKWGEGGRTKQKWKTHASEEIIEKE